MCEGPSYLVQLSLEKPKCREYVYQQNMISFPFYRVVRVISSMSRRLPMRCMIIIEMINSSRHDTIMMIIMMLFLIITVPYCSSSFQQFKWSTSSPQFQSTFSLPHSSPLFLQQTH